MVGIGVGVASACGVGAAGGGAFSAAAGGCSVGGASVAAADELEDVLILQSCDPAVTFSPSGTNNSSMTPETGDGTGMAVWGEEKKVREAENF